jgi:acyl-coenzyme A thioesterase PaaI-like protein
MTRPSLAPDTGDADDPRLAAAARAGEAGRWLLNALIASDAPVELLDATTADLHRVTDALAPYARQSRYSATAGSAIVRFRDPAIAAHHPLLGDANPIAPPLVAEEHDDGWVTVRGTYDKRAEGMPGLVHGGILAMGFDLALGIAAAYTTARPAMTGTLTLRYRAPTPLHRDVVYRAVSEPRSERTVLARGTLHVGETLCVEAEGIWVATKDHRIPRVEVGE